MRFSACLWFAFAVVGSGGCAKGEAATGSDLFTDDAGGDDDAATTDDGGNASQCTSPCDCPVGRTCSTGACVRSQTALCCDDTTCATGDSCVARDGSDSTCGAGSSDPDAGGGGGIEASTPVDSGGGGGGKDSGGGGGNKCLTTTCSTTFDCLLALCAQQCDTTAKTCSK